MTQFQTIAHPNLGMGIDTRAAIKSIAAGYASSIINMDTNSAGFVEKRKGFESFIGPLPLRVISVDEDSSGGWEFNFDPSMSFASLAQTPVMGRGKLWSHAGQVTHGTASGNDNAVRLSTDEQRDALSPGDKLKLKFNGIWYEVEVTALSGETGKLFFEPAISGYASATSLPFATLQETEIYWDSFTNNIYKAMDSDVPKTFDKADISLDVIVGTAVNTGGLDEYEIVETDVTEVSAEFFTHTISDPSPGSYLVSSFVPSEREDFVKFSDDVVVSGGTSGPIPTGLPNGNYIVQVWSKDDPTAGTNTLVEVENLTISAGNIEFSADVDATYRVVVYDVPPANTTIEAIPSVGGIIQFTLPSEFEFSFVSAYELMAGTQELVKPDSITVVDGQLTVVFDTLEGNRDIKIVTLGATSGVPSISVGNDGGVPDEEPEFTIYGLDRNTISYTEDAGKTNTLAEYSSIGQKKIVAGVGGNLFVEDNLGVFLPTASVQMRGIVEAPPSGLTWDVSQLWSDWAIQEIRYTTSTNARVYFDDTSFPLPPSGTVLSDWIGYYLEISGSAVPEFNGTFKIVGVEEPIGDYPHFVIEGSGFSRDEVETCAKMSQYSATLEMDTSQLQVGDIINSNQFPTYNPVVLEIDGNSIVFGGISGELEIYSDVTLTATRQTNLVQIADSDNAFLVGDMVKLGSYERRFKVKAVSIASPITTVELDETVEVVDSISSNSGDVLSLEARWCAAELPPLNNPQTKHFPGDYESQPKLSTARINDSLFYTSGRGPVVKYDGEYIYRAGLIPWNAHVRSYVDLDEEVLVVDDFPIPSSDISVEPGKVIFNYGGRMPPLPVGEGYYIRNDATPDTLILSPIDYDEKTGEVTFDDIEFGTVETATYSLSIPLRRQYYFKLQAYDRNNNIVASAVTNPTDCTVVLPKSGVIYHRLQAPPQLLRYDYERLDIEIYGTQLSEIAVPTYYRIATLPVKYDGEGTPQILFKDVKSNSGMNLPDDLVSNAVSGVERPTLHDQPQISSNIVTVANRLVQGNIKGYPTADVRLADIPSPDGFTLSVGGLTYSVLDPSLLPNADPGDEAYKIRKIFQSGNQVRIITAANCDWASAGEYVAIYSKGSATPSEAVYLGSYLLEYAGVSELRIRFPSEDSLPTLDFDVPEDLYIYGGIPEVPVVSGTGDKDDRLLAGLVPYVTTTEALTRAINTNARDGSVPVFARSGSSLGSGVLRLTSYDETPFTVSVDTSGVFINGVRSVSGDSYSSLSRVFPSRLLISPEKFPETFDNPLASSAVFSTSVVDLNADDGEEITGYSSFLAISSSSQSQVQSTLIVFKTGSVYAVDVVTRQQSKLESNGQGCTIPGSIRPTAQGIMFANESGIYVVTSSLEVRYIGKPMEGYWKSINSSKLAGMAGFTDAQSRKYKLSVPRGGSDRNNEVVVYDYISEEGDTGAWTTYDNIEATEWMRSGADSFYSDYCFGVWKQRRTGTDTDYRDDDQAIKATFEYSPRSFGDSGEEVLMDAVVTHVEAGDTVRVYESLDMSNDYTELDPIKLGEEQKSYAFKTSATNARVLFAQMKYENDEKDQNFKLTGIDFRVARTNALAIPDAGKGGQ